MCDVQFQEQSAVLRNGVGQSFAHYHDTQFGAKRVSTVDGKVVLTAHSLLTVEEFAFDGVRLRGAFPEEIQGKYVDLTIVQWNTMFKIVHDLKPDHARRLERAEEHYKLYPQPTATTHPSYQIVAAMLCQSTSLQMRMRVNTVFDVRGTAVRVGDSVCGMTWYQHVYAQSLRGRHSKLPLFVETKKSVPCPSHNMDFRY